MKMKRGFIVICTLAGMAAIPALSYAAPPTRGAYMSFFLGASAPEESTSTISEFNPISVREVQMEYDPGINIGGTGGYDFGYFRLEGEMSYKHADITSVSDRRSGVRYINTDGDIGAFAMMVNGFFDIHNDSPITPYLGGGIGYAAVSLGNTKGVEASTGAVNYHVLRSDDEGAFAYQVGAGLEASVSRRISFDVGYRYFGTSEVSFRKDWPNTTDMKLQSHNAMVGVRIKF